MTSLRQPDLREAITLAERRVALLRVAVATARLDADPARHRRRTVAGLSVLGAVALLGSFAWGRHLTEVASDREDRIVRNARDEEILVDHHALDACSFTRAKVTRQMDACGREVDTLQPHARVRVARECECAMGDPLCECR